MAKVEIIERAGALLSRYDVIVSDVWGVIHDGARAYRPAGDALARFRAGGGTVVLLSNAPMPSAWVAHVLDEKGVRRDCWDAIVSSGDITLRHVAQQGYSRVHHIGTERDLPLFADLGAERVDIHRAEAIICTGLVDERNETAESYRPLLTLALARSIPFVCANPDLVVDVGGEMLPCAGLIGELYETMGGTVYWAGKPHAPAYRMAMTTIARLRGTEPSIDRIIAIGDAVRTDIAGAAAFGLDSIFIGQGIHRDAVLREGRIDPACLASLLATAPASPIAAMVGVAW